MADSLEAGPDATTRGSCSEQLRQPVDVPVEERRRFAIRGHRSPAAVRRPQPVLRLVLEPVRDAEDAGDGEAERVGVSRLDRQLDGQERSLVLADRELGERNSSFQRSRRRYDLRNMSVIGGA